MRYTIQAVSTVATTEWKQYSRLAPQDLAEQVRRKECAQRVEVRDDCGALLATAGNPAPTGYKSWGR